MGDSKRLYQGYRAVLARSTQSGLGSSPSPSWGPTRSRGAGPESILPVSCRAILKSAPVTLLQSPFSPDFSAGEWNRAAPCLIGGIAPTIYDTDRGQPDDS